MTVQIAIPEQQITAFCERNQIRKLSLFGSVLRDDFAEESDIDVLVEFEPDTKVGLFALSRMARELSKLLGREVDLLTPGFLSVYFRQNAVDSAEIIYEKDA